MTPKNGPLDPWPWLEMVPKRLGMGQYATIPLMNPPMFVAKPTIRNSIYPLIRENPIWILRLMNLLHICGGFLKWGYPEIIHFNRMFHYKPSSYWRTPIDGNSHIHIWSPTELWKKIKRST